jgi:hypothetical protein
VQVLDKASVFPESRHFGRRNIHGFKQNLRCAKLECPANVAYIRSLIGLVGYYLRFVRRFSKIIKPLTGFLGRTSSSSGRLPVKLVLGIEEATNHYPSVSDD